MNEKLTVFVCGTYRDLIEEREVVLESIRKLQYEHGSMEYFGARPNTPIETCLDEVRKSDVLVVIVGHVYGSLVPGLNISYSEAEFHEGTRLEKPCLVYMRDENVPILPKFMENDPEKIKLLMNFKDMLNGRVTARSFKSPNDLASWVETDLSRIAEELDTDDPTVILERGADAWNIWRAKRPGRYLDLKNIDLTDRQLRGINLSEVNLTQSNLHQCNLRDANLSRALLTNANLEKSNLAGANLSEAKLSHAFLQQCDLQDANLSRAILTNANLEKSNLAGANLRETDIRDADLRKVDLRGASLIATEIDGARISGSWVYGTNTWNLKGEFGEQRDLVITPPSETAVTVDNINVVQFVYLIMDNRHIRDVLNTLTSKVVLILGRFAIPERKAILDALRNKLRELNLLPIVYDIDRAMDREFTETTKTLASLSYFVIADMTNPKSSPFEWQATVPDYQIPFVPIIQEGESPFAMMVDLQKKYDWVLNTVTYDSEETLMKALKPLIIDPVMKRRQELRLINAQKPEVISAKDLLAKGGS